MLRGREVFTTVAVLAAAICATASASSTVPVKQQLAAVAHELNAPAASAADTAGASGNCPLTTAQVHGALPLSTGIRVNAFRGGCAFYTGTKKELALGTQPLLLYVKESKGQLNSQWLTDMAGAGCALGSSRNANGPTAVSLCGVTRKQLSTNTGLPPQIGLAFDFETANHKSLWTVSLMYDAKLKGLRTQDLEGDLLAVLKSFS